MALTYGFYNSVNGDRKYNALQFSSIFDGIIKDGVFKDVGDHMVVTASGNGYVLFVGTGKAWFDHSWTYIDAPYQVTLDAPEPQLDRYDAIALVTNSGNNVRANSIEVVRGAAATNPVWPALNNTSTKHYHPLAYVHVRAMASSIVQGAITNMVGTSECPYVTGPLKTLSADDLLRQWEAQFNAFKAEYTNFIASAQTSFNAFMDGSRYQVDALTTQMQAKKVEFDNLVANSNTRFENFMRDCTLRWDSFSSSFETFMSESRATFNSFMSESRATFNSFIAECARTFNNFIDDRNNDFISFVDVKNEEFEDNMDEMRDDFSSFWTEFKASMVEYLREQENIWQTWFNRIQGQLSEDAATNLQKQIDALCYVFVLGERAVLGITATAIHERVVFGTYGSVTGEKIMISAPYRETVYVYGEKAVLNTTATTLDNVAAFGPYGGKTGESVIVSAPTHNPQDF